MRRIWRLQRRWATGRGRAGRTGTSGAHISRFVTMRRPSSTTRSAWRSQRRWATGRGRAGRTGTWATRIGRRGTSARPSSTTRGTWRLQKGGRRPGGRGQCVREPWVRVSVAGGLQQGHRIPRAVPGDLKGGGRPGTPMLTCSGCCVARFCSADHQKMASKKTALGRSLTTGRHKDICGVLRKWRDVVKDGVSPGSAHGRLEQQLFQGGL